MRETIRSITLYLAARLARVVRVMKKPAGVVVCCAPVPEANRGDQALLMGVVKTLREKGLTPIHLVETSLHPIESITPGSDLSIHREFAQVFNTRSCLPDQLAFLRFLRDKKNLILIGADVLDEGYAPDRSEGSLLAVHLARLAGVAARVVGFSINTVPTGNLLRRFARLKGKVPLCVRDEVSLKRLQDAGIENTRLVGDLALLMPPSPPEVLSTEVKEFFNKNPDKVVGINLTPVVMGKAESSAPILDRFAKACALLAGEHGYRFMLIPHDDQGGIEYLRDLHKRIQAQAPGIAMIADPMPSAPMLKRIAGSCVHVFTCRLHLGLATLGMARPVTGFPYQGKFEGQFAHFGLNGDSLMPTARLPDSPEALAMWMRNRTEKSPEIARVIESHLPGVLRQSLANFEDITP
ncbi:MAG: hypothetical protein GC164_15365 [Phycisphaera sp.]|nr:hypothetical protein [Phycisphaera sp.]